MSKISPPRTRNQFPKCNFIVSSLANTEDIHLEATGININKGRFTQKYDKHRSKLDNIFSKEIQ